MSLHEVLLSWKAAKINPTNFTAHTPIYVLRLNLLHVSSRHKVMFGNLLSVKSCCIC